MINDAQCAFILNTPRSRNSTTSGKIANSDVSPSEWDTGSKTCLYMRTSLIRPHGAATPRPSPAGRRAASRSGIFWSGATRCQAT